jgi:hypothetical protein
VGRRDFGPSDIPRLEVPNQKTFARPGGGRAMEETLFTSLKAIAFLLALLLLLYPAVLVVQLLTGTLTESLAQVAVLSVLSLVAWVGVIRLYRNAEFEGVNMIASE